MTARQAVVPAYLALCLLLGGASAAGFESNMLLQLLAVPIIALALFVEHGSPLTGPARQLIALLILALALIVIQLTPLPPDLWAGLPGRRQIAEGYAMLGLPLPWLPLSLAPQRTIAAALWLVPAAASLLAMLRFEQLRSSWLAWTIIGVTLVSVVIGALQTAGGEGSPWYFYQITNPGVGVGFFANANHLATLLVSTIPFLAALYLNYRSRGSRQKDSLATVLLVGALMVVFVGIAVNRSLAGIGLAVPVLAASGLMIFSRKRRLPRWWAAVLALLALGSVALAFSAPFGNNLTSEESRVSSESRYTSFSIGLRAAREFMPVGSGIGTFVEIYPTYENPATVTRVYMNHVHGDYIELALETGVLGLALIALFLLWWVRRAVAIWGSDQPNHFARAATVASAAMLAHSLVDYPLRTAALSTLFAVCCGLMAEPRPLLRRREKPAGQADARHLSAD